MPNKKTKEEFIAKAKLVHGDKYDYSKVNYVGALNKVCIICPKHGEFWQEANGHLKGQCCPKCNLEKRASSTEVFIKKARKNTVISMIIQRWSMTGIKQRFVSFVPSMENFGKHLIATYKVQDALNVPMKPKVNVFVHPKKSLLKKLVKPMATNMTIPKWNM